MHIYVFIYLMSEMALHSYVFKCFERDLVETTQRFLTYNQSVTQLNTSLGGIT